MVRQFQISAAALRTAALHQSFWWKRFAPSTTLAFLINPMAFTPFFLLTVMSVVLNCHS
jgi:hypothetical protein